MSRSVNGWVTLPRESNLRKTFAILEILVSVYTTAADCTYYYELQDADQRERVLKLVNEAKSNGFEIESNFDND